MVALTVRDDLLRQSILDVAVALAGDLILRGKYVLGGADSVVPIQDEHQRLL